MYFDLPYEIDLRKIELSGQCFRLHKHANGYYEYGNTQLVNMSRGKIWTSADSVKSIFPCDMDYAYVEAQMCKQGGYLEEAANFGSGLCILRQPLFEMVLTFIISQRNSIPRITKTINSLCNQFNGEFPTREQLLDFDWDSLNVGYRKPYLEKSVLLANEPMLAHIRQLPTTEAKIEYLKRLPGVGDKVANCIALFGLGCYDAFPIDVWIQRIIDRYFGGHFDTSWCEEYAGVVQQYMFFYERHRRDCV